jgi:hypothetical protein
LRWVLINRIRLIFGDGVPLLRTMNFLLGCINKKLSLLSRQRMPSSELELVLLLFFSSLLLFCLDLFLLLMLNFFLLKLFDSIVCENSNTEDNHNIDK